MRGPEPGWGRLCAEAERYGRGPCKKADPRSTYPIPIPFAHPRLVSSRTSSCRACLFLARLCSGHA